MVVTIPAGLTPAAADCDLEAGEAGTGLRNTTTLSGDFPDTDDACVPAPTTTFTKELVSVTANGDGTFTLVYELTVTRTGNGEPYTLTDQLQYGDAVTVDDVTITGAPAGVDARTRRSTASATPIVATDVPIADGDDARLQITVEATVDAAAVTLESSDCDRRTGTGRDRVRQLGLGRVQRHHRAPTTPASRSRRSRWPRTWPSGPDAGRRGPLPARLHPHGHQHRRRLRHLRPRRRPVLRRRHHGRLRRRHQHHPRLDRRQPGLERHHRHHRRHRPAHRRSNRRRPDDPHLHRHRRRRGRRRPHPRRRRLHRPTRRDRHRRHEHRHHAERQRRDRPTTVCTPLPTTTFTKELVVHHARTVTAPPRSSTS